MDTHRLINFRAPIAIQTMFDQVCGYRSQSRTAVLVSLMSGYISDQSEQIQKQIDSVNALKNDLEKNILFKTQWNMPRNQNNRLYDDLNRSEPLSFYSNQGF